ncbi:MAG: beta-lactamase family protein [Saprospiraceae bacterium]|nr:beta-lactamase family protein [Saprospiraceae bacterium]
MFNIFKSKHSKNNVISASIVALLIAMLCWPILSYQKKSNTFNISKQGESDISFIDTAFARMFDKQIKENITFHQCPGIAVMIMKDNHTIFQKQYGTKSVKNTEPIDQETVFRLGSVSKGFAGILAALLIDKNIISLDDPVSMYVPELSMKAKTKDKILRVRHILTHTSGLTEHAFSNLVDENHPMSTIIANLNRITPRDSTGKTYAYQNATYGLIEKVIEQATGMTYQQALDFYLLSPLDMCGTSCTYEALCHAPNVSRGHKYGGKRAGFVNIPYSPHYYNVPSAGGINAPMADMKKWLSAIMGYQNNAIPQSALNIAFTPYVSTADDDKYFNSWPGAVDSHYGLGWRIINTKLNHVIYHGGMVNGFRSEIAFDPDKKLGIVLLFNSTCSYSNQAVPLFFQLWEEYTNPFNPKLL